MLEKFKRTQPVGQVPDRREFVEHGLQLERIIGNVVSKEVLDGRLIEDIELDPWVDNVINHGLRRAPRGYIVVKRQVVLNAMHARRSSAFSLTNDAWATVTLNSERYDEAGAYNTSTGLYTCPVDGDYLISAHGRVDNMEANEYVAVALVVNGTTPDHTFFVVTNPVAGATVLGGGSTHRRFSAGNTIGLAMYQSGTAARNVQFVDTHLDIRLIDDGIRDNQSANSTPDLTLLLRCSYAQTVSLWVF